MSEQLQLRRGTGSQIASFTGAQGEVVVDTTNNRLVLQDGATAGGFATAKLTEVVTNARTPISDTAYTAQSTDRTIAYVLLTAARLVALPSAISYPTGTRLLVVDETGNCSAINTITALANGTDKIDGASSIAINVAYGYVAIESNGSSSWTIVDQMAPGPLTAIAQGPNGALMYRSACWKHW
jgi:Major tropism determinant N-terminal domain